MKYKVWILDNSEITELFSDYNEAKQYFYMKCEDADEICLLQLIGSEYKTLKYHINYYYTFDGYRI